MNKIKKTLLLLLIAATVLTAIYFILTGKRDVIEHWDNGSVKSTTIYAGFTKHGLEELHDEQGKRISSITFHHGEKNGPFTIIEKEKTITGVYKEGEYHGYMIVKNTNNKTLIFRKKYNNGTLDSNYETIESNLKGSVYSRYDNNGILTGSFQIEFSELNMDFDKFNRVQSRSEVGRRVNTVYTEVINGKLSGLSTVYGKNGHKIQVTPIEDGILNGISKGFKDKGVTLVHTLMYKNNKPNGEYKNFYDDGSLREQGVYSDGNRVGLFKEYAKESADWVINEREYENGNVKRLQSWYQNGTIKQDSTYSNNLLLLSKKYFTNGVLESDYKNMGTSTYYDKSGVIIKKVNSKPSCASNTLNYKNGKRHGVKKVFSTEGCNIVEVQEYKNGKNVNSSIWYKPNGKDIIKIVQYQDNWKIFEKTILTSKDGNKTTKILHYHENGKRMSEVDYSSDGSVRGKRKYWDESGRLRQELLARNGVVTVRNSSSEVLFPLPKGAHRVDGKQKHLRGVFEIASKNEGGFHGPRILFHPNGLKMAELNYKSRSGDKNKWRPNNWRLDGLVTTWYEDGIKQYEGKYKRNENIVCRSHCGWYGGTKKTSNLWREANLIGKHIWWNEDGAIDKIESYRRGIRNGKTTYFYPNGLKKAELNYKYKSGGRKHLPENKNLDGWVTMWYEDGTKQYAGEYKSSGSEVCGGWCGFYTGKSRRQDNSSDPWEGANLIGKHIWWNKDGSVQKEKEYGKGK